MFGTAAALDASCGTFTVQGSVGAQPAGGVRLRPAVRVVGRSGPAAGETFRTV